MIPFLPLQIEVETKIVLRKLAAAHQRLAEFKGVITSIPNQNILLETLTLREAKESSAIENIISTFAEVYQSSIYSNLFTSLEAKEVHLYAEALKQGFNLIQSSGLLTNNHILKIQSVIEQNNAGFRKVPGTKLLNEKTGEVVYMPPQDALEIESLMQNLEEFINNDDLADLDPLIKMAIIHHQFETIHPFYDGNGRTGRIINILYLVNKKLLDIPVLYLSKYIIRKKSDYYEQLQKVRETGNWEPWILFILDGIENTAKEGVLLINAIHQAMQKYKHEIKAKLPKLYSQDLLNNLFKYPYTKIEFIERDLSVSRSTAIRYLEELVKNDFLEKQKWGRESFYVNKLLFELLSQK
jgi:Fic family protein